MNLFWLDSSPTLAARFHADIHIPKGILECVQMLMTARVVNHKPASWKGTHFNHPSTKWVFSCPHAYLLTRHLAEALCIEYALRWHKRHMCEKLLRDELVEPPMEHGTYTAPPYVGPSRYYELCVHHGIINYTDPWSRVVEPYRMYYYYGKGSMCKWTNRPKPFWFGDQRYLVGEPQ